MAAGILAASVGSLINGTTRGDDTKANFWDEMSTMFDASPGSTGDDRKVLWAAAVRVFYHHPILGAGAGDFGAAAAYELKLGEVGGAYANNPKTLYRRALHNIFYEILAEFGLVGVAIILFLLYRFWQNSQQLIKPEAAVIWQAAGGTDDIRRLALGLEAGMVGFLTTGYFYNQLFQVTFYSLLFTNVLLHAIVFKNRPTLPAKSNFRRLAVQQA